MKILILIAVSFCCFFKKTDTKENTYYKQIKRKTRQWDPYFQQGGAPKGSPQWGPPMPGPPFMNQPNNGPPQSPYMDQLNQALPSRMGQSNQGPQSQIGQPNQNIQLQFNPQKPMDGFPAPTTNDNETLLFSTEAATEKPGFFNGIWGKLKSFVSKEDKTTEESVTESEGFEIGAGQKPLLEENPNSSPGQQQQQNLDKSNQNGLQQMGFGMGGQPPLPAYDMQGGHQLPPYDMQGGPPNFGYG